MELERVKIMELRKKRLDMAAWRLAIKKSRAQRSLFKDSPGNTWHRRKLP